MAEHDLGHEDAERFIMTEIFKMPTGLGRPGKPEEVAQVIALALSACGAYMSGSVINVDGGTDF